MVSPPQIEPFFSDARSRHAHTALTPPAGVATGTKPPCILFKNCVVENCTNLDQTFNLYILFCSSGCNKLRGIAKM